MHKAGGPAAANFGQFNRGFRIHAVSQRGFFLAAVHVREAGGIDENIELVRLQGGLQFIGFFQIHDRTRQGNNLMRRSPGSDKGGAKTASATQNGKSGLKRNRH
ncbi:MAG: hypothetical protein R3F31_20565 [Verrucomicrobiales bacterium]